MTRRRRDSAHLNALAAVWPDGTRQQRDQALTDYLAAPSTRHDNGRTSPMTDPLPDPAHRLREVREVIAREGERLAALLARTDHNGNVKPEEDPA